MMVRFPTGNNAKTRLVLTAELLGKPPGAFTSTDGLALATEAESLNFVAAIQH